MSYGLDVEQFRTLVVRVALQRIGMLTAAAENLVLGTALQESEGLRALKQRPTGPALGLFQIEPATHASLWFHSIPGIKGLAFKLWRLLPAADLQDDPWPRNEVLITNLLYAAAICRVRYYVVAQKLPLENDPRGLAQYWKDHYNAGGKGTVDAAFPYFQRACRYVEV